MFEIFDDRLIGVRRTTFVCADCEKVSQRESSEMLVILLPLLRCIACEPSDSFATNKVEFFQEEFTALSRTSGLPRVRFYQPPDLSHCWRTNDE